MKLYRAMLMVFFMSFSLRAVGCSDLYQPFQRDLIILINWNEALESLSYSFHPSNTALVSSGLGAIAYQLATALYKPSVPIICSLPAWAALLERAQFIADAQNLSQDDFVSKYLAIYIDEPRGKKSLLVNHDFLIKLYQFLFVVKHMTYTKKLTKPLHKSLPKHRILRSSLTKYMSVLRILRCKVF